ACRGSARRHGRRLRRASIAGRFLGFPHAELRCSGGKGLMPDMWFESSRGSAPQVSLSFAMAQGLAPDGGLYVPTRMPTIDLKAIPAGATLPEVATLSLAGFFTGDGLRDQL